VTTSDHLISVICCAHNEEEYVDKCMPNLLRALKGFSYEIIFVADRCTDSTVEKVRKYGVRVIEKNWGKWINGYAECLQTGYVRAKGKYIGIIDLDIIVPNVLFRTLVPMLKDRVASVDAQVVTYPDSFWNRFILAWEKTYNIAPLGKGHYGGARVFLKKVLDEVGGFRDVFSVDTDVDVRLRKIGYRSVSTSAVWVFHARLLSLGVIVRKQIRMGRGRFMVGYGFMRTLAHSVFRFRPLVIGGWLMEWIRRKSN
jgi:glycosyltransferase involved in cell wall biosynthesis